MDIGNGRFEYIPKGTGQAEKLQALYPNHGGTFREGEEIEIKGSLFRVSKIIRNGLKLELLPR
jgi:hypothetical protein